MNEAAAPPEKRVGLLVVSHSRTLAQGVVELAGQMAGETTIIAAGGADDGSLGTSFETIADGLSEADIGAGVVVLCDLGSAVLTSETAREMADDPARIRIADAPLVEGAVAAAVVAEHGASLQEVAAAAEAACGAKFSESGADGGSNRTGVADSRVAVVVGLPGGLHARPAAEVVRLAASFEADTTLNGTDAKSVLSVIGLGVRNGDTVEVAATGPDADAAVAAVAKALSADTSPQTLSAGD